MPLQTVDKPNLYFASQLLINHILGKISAGNSLNSQIHYHLFELKQVFRDNIASTTTHLEAIANLCKEYIIYCNNADRSSGVALVDTFIIDGSNNTVTFSLNPKAVERVNSKDFHIEAHI